MVSVQRRKPRRIRRRDQRALINIKSDIEKSKDKLCFIKHVAVGSAQDKWYLLQVDIDKSDLVIIRDYGVYQCR